MKSRKRCVTYLLLILTVFLFALPMSASAAKVKMNKSKITLYVGQTYNLKVLNRSGKFKWSSSSKKVASVSSKGKIKAVKKGKAKITAQAKNNKKVKVTCTVTVKARPVAVKAVGLSQSQITMKVGEKKVLAAAVSPKNATNKTITWTSNKPSIAQMSNGKVVGKKKGTALITAASADGKKKAYCMVKVEAKTNSSSAGTTEPDSSTETGSDTGTAVNRQPSAKAKEFLRVLQKYSDQIAKDKELGIQWSYKNGKGSSTWAAMFTTSRTTKKAYCDCALLARWALREIGVIASNHNFWDTSPTDGNDTWKFTKEAARQALLARGEILYPNKTVKELLAEGNLLPGDIVGWKGLGHTNIYAGDGKWYDAGRGTDGGYVGGTYVYNSFGPVARDKSDSVVAGIIRITK